MHEELKRLADFFKDAVLSEECKIKILFQQINSCSILNQVNTYSFNKFCSYQIHDGSSSSIISCLTVQRL